jgi:diguanylate cyclase (GGDEF)-like protein/PAS domain S-box-containing protein
MRVVHDPFLVVLSVLAAILAAFAALSLAGRLVSADREARRWWLGASAAALGGGIWSMHFLGMLALEMPVHAAYDVRLTVLSLVISVAVTWAGLFTVSRFGAGWRTIAASGVLVGLGVAAMHYVGMAGMDMPGVTVNYDPLLVLLSIAIAIVAATAALRCAFRRGSTASYLLASVLMGAAIAGMHYTAVAAASFTLGHHPTVVSHTHIERDGLAFGVVAATSALLLLGLIIAYFDRKLSRLTRHEAELLQANERRYRALIENADDIICVLDPDGTVTYESSNTLRLLGYPSTALVGRRFRELVPTDCAPKACALLEHAMAQPGRPISGEMRLLAGDGSFREFEAIATSMLHDPAVGGIIVNLHDVTERKALVAKLEAMSETDVLTGLVNRRGFLKRAEQELARSRRSNLPLTVVMVDVDHFKRVNDRYGHAAGDLVLSMIAEQCRSVMREVDIIARFGGEEFVLLLPDTTVAAGHTVVSRLGRAIAAAKVATIKGEVSVTASFGLAAVDPDGDLESALRLADEALYEAKHAGRDCIRIRA